MASPEGHIEIPHGNLPIEATKEKLPREELVRRANNVLLLFAERAISFLHEEVREGRGKQAVATTQEGRPGEELLRIDQPAEDILKTAIREAHLPAVLFTEGTPEPTEFNNGDGTTEKFFVYIDPFDNSSPYKKGLDIPPYTVCSIWDKDGQPIGAVIGDIKERKAYVSMDGEVFIWDFEKKILEEQNFKNWQESSLKDHIRLQERKNGIVEENPEQVSELRKIDSQIAQFREFHQGSQEHSGESLSDETALTDKKKNLINQSPILQQLIETEKQIASIKENAEKVEQAFRKNQNKEPERKLIERSRRITLTDSSSTLASFLGEKEYSLPFFEEFNSLVNAMHHKGYLYPGGGAFIYGLLASGAVDAYVMRNEPLSEIIPGLPLALTAGCTVVSVSEDGTFQEFKFNPNAIKENHRLYSEGVVSLFIAAATPEIRDEIIRHYRDEKRKKEEGALPPQEHVVFPSTPAT